MTIDQLLYNIINNSWFWPVLILWLFAALVWAERWRKVLERSGNLIPKPIIFNEDPEPDNVPLYPRRFMEQVANGLRTWLRKPLSDLLRNFGKFISQQYRLVYNPEHPFQTVMALVFLASLIFFIYADAIAVAGTLQVLGLWDGELPEPLRRFDLAVFGGSLLALLMSFFVFFEVNSEKAENTRIPDRGERLKRLYFGIAMLTVVLSIIALVAGALARLEELGRIPESPTLSLFVDSVLYGLVPINSAMAASLILAEAIPGIVVVFIVLEWILFGFFYILDYVLTVIGGLLPFLGDFLYRLVYIILDVTVWFLATPFLAIAWPFVKIVEILRGK